MKVGGFAFCLPYIVFFNRNAIFIYIEITMIKNKAYKMNEYLTPEEQAKKDEEELKKEIQKRTKAFMKSCRAFLADKTGSEEVPPELELSLMMLESYFKEFMELTAKIDKLPSLTIMGRYGETPNPILNVRDKAAARLESLMKATGLTVRTQQQMGFNKPEKEGSALEKWMESQKAGDSNKGRKKRGE